MAHLYEVQSSEGTHQVETDHHHEHLSKADFERILLQAVANMSATFASSVVLHRYVYRGHR